MLSVDYRSRVALTQRARGQKRPVFPTGLSLSLKLLFDFDFGCLLFDTGSFAGETAHIVDASPANMANLDELYASDRGAVEGECTFDADATGDFADNKRLANTMASALNDDAFVKLNALLLVFDDADKHPDGVATRERGNVFPNLAGGNFIDDIGIHLLSTSFQLVFSSGS
jgi:hypothetical protein